MKIRILILLVAVSIVGCATIRNYNKLNQPEGSTLTASIGSVIFALNRSSDLPNVFGKADLYGGKVDKGFTELKLKSVLNNGNLLLQVTDLSNASTETTMDRYRQVPRVSVDNKINIGNNQTSGTTTFEFDPSIEKTLVIGGVQVTFIEVKPYSVIYKLKLLNE